MKFNMNTCKICKVCGDKALGFNFNGLSCSSCRLFFYRNSSKSEKLTCPKSGECEIDFATRKCCPKCRLVKCFAIGMKAKANNKHKLIEKDTSDNSNESDLIRSDSSNAEMEIELILGNNIRDNLTSLGDGNDSQYLLPKKRLFTNDLRRTKIGPHKERFELSKYEKEEIDFIGRGMDEVFGDEYSLEMVGEASSYLHAFNLPCIYARRTVKFCKKLEFFRSLAQKDQLKILKPFCFSSFAIRFCFQFNEEKGGFTLLENEEGNRSIFVSKTAFYNESDPQNVELNEANKPIVVLINQAMENDCSIRNLLTTILLAQPMEDCAHPEFIRYYYCVYCYLLKRYLENKYRNVEQARRKYVSLMKLIFEDLNQMKENSCKLYFRIGLDQVADIIVEAMDLKEFDAKLD